MFFTLALLRLLLYFSFLRLFASKGLRGTAVPFIIIKEERRFPIGFLDWEALPHASFPLSQLLSEFVPSPSERWTDTREEEMEAKHIVRYQNGCHLRHKNLVQLPGWCCEGQG